MVLKEDKLSSTTVDFIRSEGGKGSRTIRNLLVSPKDKDPMVNQSGTIYWYQCGDLGCDDEYIGETSRTFGERLGLTLFYTS